MNFLETIQHKLFTIDIELRRACIAFLVLISVGTVVYASTEHWSILDSLYFSVITLTTVGYGDMHPTAPLSKAFTVGFVLVGVGLVFYIFTSLAHHLFQDEKKEILKIEQTLEHLEALLKSKEDRKQK